MPRFVSTLALCAVALHAPATLLGQPSAASAARPAAPIPIPLEAAGGGLLRKVKVVAGGDTLDFLLDTGGGVTIISPALAAKTGCAPSGLSRGYRMTGERLESPVCRAVALEVGGFRTTVEASTMDLGPVLGPGAPRVDGMLSLRTFAGQAITLDVSGGQLTVESAASLERRARGMTPLRMRLATGLEGGELTAYVAVPAAGEDLWLEWDSGNAAPTLLTPRSARLLGLPDSARGGEARLAMAPGVEVLAPVAVREIIHDGVLSAGMVARAVWTADLATGRLWAGPVRPLLGPPAAPPAAVVPPARDPAGWYEVTLVVGGERQRAVMQVARAGAGLAARLRFVGDETEYEMRDVSARGEVLEMGLPMRQTYPVRLRFDGLAGAGTWGDPATRGGVAEAVKVR
jgi:hypothetical protein